MANDESHILQRGGNSYVPWKVGLKHPKLSWVIAELNRYGIAHYVGSSMRGQMLYVERGTIEVCSVILDAVIAEVGNVRVIVDDLPNDHDYFQRPETPAVEAVLATMQDVLDGVPVADAVSAEDFDDTDEDLESAVNDWDENEDEELSVGPDPDEDEDGWGFDEDDLDEGPTPDNVIDISHRVVDPEFQAEPAEPRTPKPKREKPVPQPVNDPDFATGEDPPPTAVLGGTEFLRADQVLSFSEVLFPKTEKPIRMYDVMSSNVSAMGYKELVDNPLVCTFYIRYKSGAYVYRYNPVPKADANEALNLAVRRQEGIQEASVGSYLHYTIIDKANEDLIKCQRLEADEKGERWVIVPPKKARTKAIKDRAKA